MTIPVGTIAVSTTPLAQVSEAAWERLLFGNPTASAFSLRAVHAAWWGAHVSGAVDVSLAARNAVSGELLGYLPLMRRPDGLTHSGATLHIDYASVLLTPLPGGGRNESTSAHDEVADALATALIARNDPLQLRRIRPADAAHMRMTNAIQRAAATAGRAAKYSIEEPAPYIDLQGVGTLDEHLVRMEKKQRHEIRRKVRRGQAAGVQIRESENISAELPEFIRLHRARWGVNGLFAATEKGREEESFMRELFATAPRGTISMSFARSDTFGTFAVGIFLRDASALRYWNAGGDTAARALSPGVLLFVHGLSMAIQERLPQLDFLRGNESYKYECGAVDAQVMQLQVPA